MEEETTRGKETAKTCFQMILNTVYNGDCIDGLRALPDGVVNCCVTSPPYFGLRDYGMDGQIGLEETPNEYVEKMVNVFREVKRVLRDDGTLWLNIGDSYAGSGKGSNCDGSVHLSALNSKQGTHKGTIYGYKHPQKAYTIGLKNKDLIGIPWRLAFALQADGWYLRQDIIWHKPNPMPESVTDRCTKSHEYIFLLSKSAKYYYDYEAIKQPMTSASISRLTQDVENQLGSDRVPNKTNGRMKAVGMCVGSKKHKNLEDNGLANHSFHRTRSGGKEWENEDGKANKRSVWTVTTKPFKEAHFATFPEDLIVDCIKAGCPEGGIVLDPFMGAGTTALVARKLNRNYYGTELNPAYIKIYEKRMRQNLGMFL